MTVPKTHWQRAHGAVETGRSWERWETTPRSCRLVSRVGIASMNRDWEIWGPNGGYIASIALRAAGAATELARPATFSCLFLGVGSFDSDIDIDVISVRRAKRAEALRVCITQADRPLLEAHVWAVDGGLPGLEHDVAVAPDVPSPGELASMKELMPEEQQHRFWRNFDAKPTKWIPPEEWPPPPPADPSVLQWMRFSPVASYEDEPWMDACRAVVLLDTFQWPAANRGHIHRGPTDPAFIAPNMDLSIRFHRLAAATDWLLVDTHAPIAEGGLMAAQARVWSEDRRLIASGSGHLLCREVPRGTPGSGTVAS
jgi:acyl-CoA thioesterase-2